MDKQVDAELRQLMNAYVAGDKPEIAGLLYVAFREDGEPVFEHYAGAPGVASEAGMNPDTVMWMASFTKLICAVACMQLVENGKMGLDDADKLEALLPELARVKVLSKCQGKFVLDEKKTKITLRMLLSHTCKYPSLNISGFGYAFEDDNLANYGRPIGFDDFAGELSDLVSRPLVNQPGEVFQYGTSMDWVGIMIERLSGLDLEQYVRKNVLDPLGMKDITLFPSETFKSNLAYMHRRGPDGTLSKVDHLYRKPLLPGAGDDKNRHCAGGHGCFGKPAQMRKLIGCLLNDGVDSATGFRVLQKKTIDEMFTDQIPNKPRYSNICVPIAKPELANATPLKPLPDDHTEGWGLGFSLSHFPTETGRPAGVGSWEGLANLFWFADRENKLGGVIATQILPYGDSKLIECSNKIEAKIYEQIQKG